MSDILLLYYSFRLRLKLTFMALVAATVAVAVATLTRIAFCKTTTGRALSEVNMMKNMLRTWPGSKFWQNLEKHPL